MNLLQDIITYVRRIIKSPSDTSITNNLIVDYINRFWINDVDARIQLFDLKTKYQFQTVPGVDQYNMPLYDVQISNPGTANAGNPQDSISFYPVYQGFMDPVYINGVPVSFSTQRSYFFQSWWNCIQNLPNVGIGDGSAGPYQLSIPFLAPPAMPLNPPLTYLLRGHVDISGVIATGNNIDPPFGNTLNTLIPSTSIYSSVYFTSVDPYGNNIVIQDSGQFLQINSAKYANFGMLMKPGTAPFGYSTLPNGYTQTFVITGATSTNPVVLSSVNSLLEGQLVQISGISGMTELNGNTYKVTSSNGVTVTIDVDGTSFNAYISGGVITSMNNVVNYSTGQAVNVFFPENIPDGANIAAQCYYFSPGLPRSVLYNNGIITLRSPPDRQYLVELDAYLSPAAYLNTADPIKFGYMSEYIARGAARKILSDTGDVEQMQFYEPLFKEQEMLVWKRSQRQFTSTRTQTIYSSGANMGCNGNGIGFTGL